MLRTANSAKPDLYRTPFEADYAAITLDGAEWLVAHMDIRLIGIDYLSVQRHELTTDIHRVILGAGIAILEGLDLRATPPGEYELVCLPLRLAGVEAAPARAILRPTGAPMPRIAAFVPMRHNSERVMGKNYRPLGGRPLYHHIVAALLACDQIDEVVIDTDSPLITADAAAAFPACVCWSDRSTCSGGDVPMNDVLLNDIEQVPADLYVQTHSTNPLLRRRRSAARSTRSWRAGGRYDSLFTVTPLQTRLWTAEGQAINHDPAVLLRTQDLPPVMEENSCLYVFDGDTLRRRDNRIGERPLLYPIEPEEAWDIDEESDWSVVEALYAAREAA